MNRNVNMSKLPNKILNTLGLETETLLKQCFNSSKSKSLGSILKDVFEMFWLSVSGRKNDATTFLIYILERLSSKLKKRNNSDGPDPSLLNTIQFVSLFIDFNTKDPRLQGVMSELMGKDKILLLNKWLPGSDKVLELLKKKMSKQTVINSLVVSASTLYGSNINFNNCNWKEEKKQESDDLADIFRETGYFSFIFPYLQNIVQTSKSEDIIEKLCSHMVTLPAQKKSNLKYVDTTLMATLHMFGQFLTVRPIGNYQVLKQCMLVIQNFYLWPKPYGIATRDLLTLIKYEMYAPGTAMRNKFTLESTVLQLGSKKKHVKRDRPLFYIIDTDDIDARSLAYTMSLEEFDEEGGDSTKAVHLKPYLSAETKALLLLNMFTYDYGDDLYDEIDLLLELYPEDVDEFYEEGLILMDECLKEKKVDLATTRRQKGLDALKQKMERRKKTNSKGTLRIMSTQKPKKTKKREKLMLAEELPISYVPQLPELKHMVFFTTSIYHMIKKTDAVKIGLAFTYPNTLIFTQLTQMLKQFKGNKDSPVQLRLVITGNDQILHNVLCAYLSIIELSPDLLVGIQPRFFLVPQKQNNVARYISRYDSWYNRHVYVPFATPKLIVPWIREELYQLEDKQAPSKGDLAPGKFFRNLVESYVRDAMYSFPINVFKIECWNDSSEAILTTKGANRQMALMPDQVIPFFQRVEIGYLAECQRYIQKEGLPSETKVSEVSKQFKTMYNPPELQVCYDQMNLKGERTNSVMNTGACYRSIVLSNVPREGDDFAEPNPSEDWLELWAQAAEKSKQNVRGNHLLSDPNQHVIKVDIACSPNQEPFHILIDGQLFGPYSRLSISTCIDSRTDTPAVFPISTFFPLNL